VRDYRIHYVQDGVVRPLVEVAGNYQRVNRHAFDPIPASAVRIHITATNGDPIARIYEVRVYS